MTLEQLEKGNELLEKIEETQNLINQLEVIEKDEPEYKLAIIKRRDSRDAKFYHSILTKIFPVEYIVAHALLHLKAKKRSLEVELENIK